MEQPEIEHPQIVLGGAFVGEFSGNFQFVSPGDTAKPPPKFSFGNRDSVAELRIFSSARECGKYYLRDIERRAREDNNVRYLVLSPIQSQDDAVQKFYENYGYEVVDKWSGGDINITILTGKGKNRKKAKLKQLMTDIEEYSSSVQTLDIYKIRQHIFSFTTLGSARTLFKKTERGKDLLKKAKNFTFPPSNERNTWLVKDLSNDLSTNTAMEEVLSLESTVLASLTRNDAIFDGKWEDEFKSQGSEVPANTTNLYRMFASDWLNSGEQLWTTRANDGNKWIETSYNDDKRDNSPPANLVVVWTSNNERKPNNVNLDHFNGVTDSFERRLVTLIVTLKVDEPPALTFKFT
jgi:hypothetical protein